MHERCRGARSRGLAPKRRVPHCLRIGDRVRIVTPDPGFDYLLEATYVVPPERVDLIRPGAAPRLALVTCFRSGTWAPPPIAWWFTRAPRRRAPGQEGGRTGHVAGEPQPPREVPGSPGR
jgi:hypothetical protein